MERSSEAREGEDARRRPSPAGGRTPARSASSSSAASPRRRGGTFLDKSEVADRVVTVLKNFQKVDPAKVTPSAHFQNDLPLGILDTVELVMALEEEFGFEIPDNEADEINSINLAVDFIASHPQAK